MIVVKECIKKTEAIYNHVETHAHENKLWQDEKLSKLTCVKKVVKEGRK